MKSKVRVSKKVNKSGRQVEKSKEVKEERRTSGKRATSICQK